MRPTGTAGLTCDVHSHDLAEETEFLRHDNQTSSLVAYCLSADPPAFGLGDLCCALTSLAGLVTV